MPTLADNLLSPSGAPRSHVRSAIVNLGADRKRFAGLRDRHIDDVSNIGRKFQELGIGLSSAVAQRFRGTPTNFSSALSSATQRAKARSGIQSRGEQAIRNQQLRDRIGIVRGGRQRQGRLIDSLGRARQIQEGVDLSAQAAGDFSAASRGDFLGGLAGSAAAFIKNDGFSGLSSLFGSKSPETSGALASGVGGFR